MVSCHQSRCVQRLKLCSPSATIHVPCQTSAGAQKYVPGPHKQVIRPSSPSSLAKRAVPGEFTLPRTAKRQKKDKPNQSPKPAPVTKRMPKRKYTTEALSREIAGPAEPETIVISSDEEPVPKRSRREESYRARSPSMNVVRISALSDDERMTLVEDDRSDDSEVDYEYTHDALNIHRRANWKKSVYPAEQALLRQDDDISATFAGMSISSEQLSEEDSQPKYRRRGANSDGQHMIASTSGYYDLHFVWTMSRALREGRSSDHFPTLRHLRPTMTLARAPGGVNRVVQNRGSIAVASSASGGYEDLDAEVVAEVDPYNRDGALSVWYEGKQYKLLAHRRVLNNDPEYTLAPVVKNYAVQDVQFNPAFPSRLASSANDHTVRIWDCSLLSHSDRRPRRVRLSPAEERRSSGNDETRGLVHTVECDCTMGKLLFKPGEPVLAMGAHDGSVYLLRDNGGDKRSPAPTLSHLPLSRRADDLETGDIAWGLGSQANKLFASSMTKEEKGFSGTHIVFDALTERVACTLRLDEAGDSIDVHPTGTTVAIATKSAKHAHSLYLFDAARQNPKAAQKVELDSFHQSVTTMRFSPDGVYLALARDDNTTDVYDTRRLSRGKLHAFTHEPGNVFAYSKDIYGVVEAQWVEGRPTGLGLVTGGCDGAVRLWDVRLASDDPSNGVPIAQCQHDLGHFSLGNINEKEEALVTGEMSGKVTIFDRKRGHR
ncbi:WD40-repeat-containing domain protein [Fomitopsis betulina]|nr:WD40-repeat-containing domain protein [Fomitopsis betulina]